MSIFPWRKEEAKKCINGTCFYKGEFVFFFGFPTYVFPVKENRSIDWVETEIQYFMPVVCNKSFGSEWMGGILCDLPVWITSPTHTHTRTHPKREEKYRLDVLYERCWRDDTRNPSALHQFPFICDIPDLLFGRTHMKHFWCAILGKKCYGQRKFHSRELALIITFTYDYGWCAYFRRK